MQIYVSDSAYNLSVKGRGTTGVTVGDGVNTVVLAWLPSGTLGWLCSACRGEGLLSGERFKTGFRPRCDGCLGTGIRVQYANLDTAKAAVKRYLEERTLAPSELAELRAEQRQRWWAANKDLVKQVNAHAELSWFLRRLLRSLNRDRLWSSRQIEVAQRLLAAIADPPPSRFCGQIGEKIEFTGVLQHTSLTMTARNARRYSVTVTGDGDFEGCWFRMMGGARVLQMLLGFDGDRVCMSGTVKAHRTGLGVSHTWITHPELLLQYAPELTAEQQEWPGELHGISRTGSEITRRVRDGRHAYNLLGTLFSNLRYGPITKAELIMEGAEPVTFTPEDVIGEDRQGRYCGLLVDDAYQEPASGNAA